MKKRMLVCLLMMLLAVFSVGGRDAHPRGGKRPLGTVPLGGFVRL